MRIFNSLIMPKYVKGGPLDFFNIHSDVKPKNRRGDPLKTLKNYEKKVSQSRKRGGKISWRRKIGRGDPSGFCISR